MAISIEDRSRATRRFARIGNALRFAWRCGRTASFCLMALGALSFLVFSALPRAAGYEVRAVLSGSMEPAIPTGAAIYIDKGSREAFDLGAAIVFRGRGRPEPTVHRIVGIHKNDGVRTYVTRGDANSRPDPEWVPHSDVIGEAVLDIPYAGYAAHAIDSRLGGLLFLSLPGFFLFVSELPTWYRFVRFGGAAFAPRPREDALPAVSTTAGALS